MTALPARLLAHWTPRPTPAEPLTRAAMQRDRLRSATAWLVAGGVGAQFAAMSAFAADARAGGWAWALPGVALVVAMLLVGAAQLVLHARAGGGARRAWGMVAVVATGLLLTPLAGLLSILLTPVHLLLPVLVAGIGLALLVPDPRMRAGAPRPVRAAMLGVGVAGAMLAVGVLDGLVLLPLTLGAPLPLDAIYAALAAANEAHGTAVVVWWAAVWAVAIGVLAAGLLRNRRADREALGALLAATVLAASATPVVQFALGMSLGDTLAISGGFSSGFGAVQLALVVLTALASWLLIGARRR